MSSIKARKGNPFEYNTQYSLLEGGYITTRLDDNSKGIDLIVDCGSGTTMFIECKRHKGFSWNQLKNFYDKTKETVGQDKNVLLIFKANRQPTLVMHEQYKGNVPTIPIMIVEEFSDYFGCEWKKRPKGWKIYKETNGQSKELHSGTI